MSPERPPSDNGGPLIETQNMVLSTLDTGSQHVIIQQQQQSHLTAMNCTNMSDTRSATNYTTYTATGGQQPSKVLLLQQQHLPAGDNYLTAGLKSVAQSTGNGIGNIVLLATQDMDIGQLSHYNGQPAVTTTSTTTGTDEELTSLAWLHDKNLLKGINLTTKPVEHHSPVRHVTAAASSGQMMPGPPTGHHMQQTGSTSPTSDFMDDSCVSEDMVSSANSSSDQGISVYSTETSPTGYHYINNNNNNNIHNKNRNHMAMVATQRLSPADSTDQPINGNRLQNGQFDGSGGTISHQVGSTLQPIHYSVGTTTLTQTVTPIHHQHFHKKYLREEHVKQLTQMSLQAPQTVQSCSSPEQQQPQQQDSPPPMKLPPQTTVINQIPGLNPTHPNHHLQFHLHQQMMSGVGMMEPTDENSSCSSGSPNHPVIIQSPMSSKSNTPQKQKHPTNLPYDPLVHTANKPPLSFSSLIYLAIEDAHEKALPVKEIYAWIIQNYPYFKTAPPGWKNSVRHNLSLNKCFQKVEKAPNMGKGSLWKVEQQYKQNLIQALSRSSYHPAPIEKSGGFKTSTPRPMDSPTVNNVKSGARPFDADLFPHLSKYMSEIVNTNGTTNSIINHGQLHLKVESPSPPRTPPSVDDVDYHRYPHLMMASATMPPQLTNGYYRNGGSQYDESVNDGHGDGDMNAERIARDWGADSIDDVNAATAMLALKHGPKVFSEHYHNGNPPIITTSPSEDHTYSAGIGNAVINGSATPTNNNVTVTTTNSNGSITLNGSLVPNTNIVIINRPDMNQSDNNSNGTSSDAAYESSEESQSHILTQAELEAKRHAEGVDAFLTFATEVSAMPSPIKRPLIEYDTHPIYGHPLSDDRRMYVENIPIGATVYYDTAAQRYHHNNATFLSTPSPPKKSRSRTLRTKLKKRLR